MALPQALPDGWVARERVAPAFRVQPPTQKAVPGSAPSPPEGGWRTNEKQGSHEHHENTGTKSNRCAWEVKSFRHGLSSVWESIESESDHQTRLPKVPSWLM
jgi:hypothetical protein